MQLLNNAYSYLYIENRRLKAKHVPYNILYLVNILLDYTDQLKAYLKLEYTEILAMNINQILSLEN